jgi:Domain of unknown function (DUF4350)
MPGFLATSDRKLLAATGAVMLVLLALIAVASPQSSQRGISTPSSYAADSGGALAAYLLLKDMHRSITRWEEPPTEIPGGAGEDSVLILADPTQEPTGAEQDALRQFVEKGGRVLFTGPNAGSFFSRSHAAKLYDFADSQTYEANLPSQFTRGAEKIEMRPEAEWTHLSGPQIVLYGDPNQPAVVTWRIGKGRILWWAGASPLTNEQLSDEHNLELFLDAVSDSAAGPNEQPDIYWDEYYHGERGSLWGYVAKTPLPWGILQIGIIGLAVFFTFGRRSGPISIPAPISRRSPLEFVDTLAGLYQRAHAEPAMVGISYQRLRSALTRQLRLPPTTMDSALGQAVGQRLGVNGVEFVRTLQRAAAANRAEKVSPAVALSIVQGLEEYEEQFGLKRRKSQEKT